MKKILFLFLMTNLFTAGFAQDRFFTKKGQVTFDATTQDSPEDISARHNTLVAVLDIKSGNIQFSTLMKAFVFKKALMEEHFNENYVESEKYPKCEFKGSIVNNAIINYSKDGTYPAKVKGIMNLHGVSKEMEASGSVIVSAGVPQLMSTFSVLLSDFKISVPSVVSDKVSKKARISIDCTLEPLKK